MNDQNRSLIFAAIDDLTAGMNELTQAGTRILKTAAQAWFESLDAQIEAPRRSAHTSGRGSLMDIKETADYLKVSDRSIRDWINNEGFPVRRVGSDLRFDLAEVDEWTMNHRQPARPVGRANDKVQALQARLQSHKENI